MFEIIINSFNDILTKKYSFLEILLNVSFILIIGLILYIFYWHNINRKIAKINRCKINLNSEGGIYNLYGIHNQTKIYKVRYDNSTKHNASIDCSCPIGNIPNKFKIPIYDAETKNTEIYDKYCVCDKYYDTSENNAIYYDGDPFLIDYYKNNYDNKIGAIKNKNVFIQFPAT